jgi:hypothetical protein
MGAEDGVASEEHCAAFSLVEAHAVTLAPYLNGAHNSLHLCFTVCNNGKIVSVVVELVVLVL